jgi:hypothetical protein
MSFRPACLSLATIAGLVVALAGAGPAFAQGTEEERRACTPDAMRLCREYIPNIDRIVACMVARREELSPACQAFIKPEPPPVEIATAPVKPAVRRTASRATGRKPAAAKPRTAKPVVRGTQAAASRTPARPLNLLPAAAKPAPAKKVSTRSKQAQRAQ